MSAKPCGTRVWPVSGLSETGDRIGDGVICIAVVGVLFILGCVKGVFSRVEATFEWPGKWRLRHCGSSLSSSEDDEEDTPPAPAVYSSDWSASIIVHLINSVIRIADLQMLIRIETKS